MRLKRRVAELRRYVGASPDRPARLDLGGGGRPVVGKLAVSPPFKLEDVNNYQAERYLYVVGVLRLDVPRPTPPQRGLGGDKEEYADVLRAWHTTAEAAEQYARLHSYEIHVNADGSFRCDDVPPGNYELIINADPIPSGSDGADSASQTVPVVVPAHPIPPTDDVLNIGDVKVGGLTGGEGL